MGEYNRRENLQINSTIDNDLKGKHLLRSSLVQVKSLVRPFLESIWKEISWIKAAAHMSTNFTLFKYAKI